MPSVFRTYTSAAKSTSPQRNKGGTVVMGGNVDSVNVTVAPSMKTMSTYTHKNGSVINAPISTGDIATGDYPWKHKFQAISGTYGVMTAGRYIARRYCNFLAGNAYTKLNSGSGTKGARSIHYKDTFRTVHQIAVGWSYVTGRFLAAPYMTTDSFGNDNAGSPTRSVPGEFTITDHGLAKTGALGVPTNKDYPSRTG